MPISRNESNEIEDDGINNNLKFGTEIKCKNCSMKFNLLRRRHHCRSCYVAICKDSKCSLKIINKIKNKERPEWYCIICLKKDGIIENNNINKINNKNITNDHGIDNLNLSNQYINTSILLNNNKKINKYCIECGNELPCNVKFCIECGTLVKLESPVHIINKTNVESYNELNNELNNTNTTNNNNSSIDNNKLKENDNYNTISIEEKDQLTKKINDLIKENEILKIKIQQFEISTHSTGKIDSIGKKITKTNFQDNIIKDNISKDNNKDDKANDKANDKDNSNDNNKDNNKDKMVDQIRIEMKQDNNNNNETYDKYFKLIKMGMPLEQVKIKCLAEGLDPAKLEVENNNRDLSIETNKKIDEKYNKYLKLIQMGMPLDQAKLKCITDGLDPLVLENIVNTKNDDKNDNKNDKKNDNKNDTFLNNVNNKVMIDEKYNKFFKLIKMGMPLEQVKIKCLAEGLDPLVLGTKPETEKKNETKDSSLQKINDLENNTQYEKFYKLLKMGMPIEQVKLKVIAEGLDPSKLVLNDNNKENEKVITNNIVESNNNKNGPKLQKKNIIQPVVEMRAFFWTRIPINVVSSTVWSDINDEKIQINNKILEWMFRKNSISISSSENNSIINISTITSNSNNNINNNIVLLLDPKRQQNVGIAISRFRLTPLEIKDALMKLDETIINHDKINNLLAIGPTAEEIELIKNYDGDKENLGAAESFFNIMLTIPRYTQRIKCFKFKLSFETRVLESQSQLDILTAATNQMIDSKNFKKVLETILAIGNYMNGNTPRGGAYGFKLDALTKLSTIKSIEQKITLNYLAKHIEENETELLLFYNDLIHLEDAKRISISQLKSDINVFNSELTMLQMQIKESINENQEIDFFYKIMMPFSKDAAEILNELNRDMNNLEHTFDELVSSFCEDPRKFSTIEFFSLISEFIQDFKKCHSQNHSKEFMLLWENHQKSCENMEQHEVEKKEINLKVLDDKNKKDVNIPSDLGLKNEEIKSVENKSKMKGEKVKEIDKNIIQQELKIEKTQTNKIIKESKDDVSSTTEITKEKDIVPIIHENKEKKNNIENENKVIESNESMKLYNDIINELTIRSNELNNHNIDLTASNIETFKKISRKYGINEINSEDFINYIGTTYGKKIVIKIIPMISELLPTIEKKTNLMESYNYLISKQKNKNKSKDSNINKIKFNLQDITPLEGEAAIVLHKSILESVCIAFNHDNTKIEEFTSNARKYGSQDINATDFYNYLLKSFEPDFVGRLIPDLARLLHDTNKRHALLRALCEAAPGWEKFAGL